MSKKVVHVLGAMNAGGVEAWLMTLLRNTDKKVINHEFIVHSKEKAFYDDEVYSLGSKIHYCCNKSNPFIYIINLYRILKKIKPDVVHSHVHTFSGLVLCVAFLCKIPIRISHSHSDTRLKESKAGLFRRIYLALMKSLIILFATKKLAVSSLAAECLYGSNWSRKKDCFVVMCGIDLIKYKPENKSEKIYNNLNLPEDAFVLGHVGRFSEPKNHDFLIDVFYNLRNKNKEAYLIMVGDGELKGKIEEKVKNYNLTEYVRFMGLRNDVPNIMLSVFDVLVFPSLWEGLPLTLIEAQAANLKCFISNEITKDVDCGLVKYLPLSKEIWVNELDLIVDCSLKNMDYSDLKLNNELIKRFDISFCVKQISGFYE